MMNMKKICVIALLGLLSLGAFAQSNKMLISIGTFKKKCEGNDILFATLVDRITNGIVNTRKFNVVDNARLKEALAEQKKIDMGMSKAKGTPKRGNIKCAGYVIYGTVLMLGIKADMLKYQGVIGEKMKAMAELNVRFMNAETGELVASKTVKAERSTSRLRSGAHLAAGNHAQALVQEAIQAAADKVVERLMELAFPTSIIRVTTSKVYVNLTEERAKKGDLFQVFFVGEELVDPDTGESLGGAEEKLGELKIIRTSPKFAIAVPVAPLTTAKLKKGMILRPVTPEELEKREAQTEKQSSRRFKRRF
jgi:curli biogenesis system outer membrane secretion channel CsgG